MRTKWYRGTGWTSGKRPAVSIQGIFTHENRPGDGFRERTRP